MSDLDLFFDLALEMQGVISPNGHLMKLNESWSEHLGWTQEEIKSRPFIELIHPDDAPAVSGGLSQRTKNTQTIRWLHKNGSYRDFLMRTKLHPDGKSLLVVADDVTRERDLNIYMGEMERVAQIGYWSWDLRSLEVVWSDEVYHLHEIPKGTKITKDMVVSYFIPDHQKLLERMIKECLERGSPYDIELSFQTTSGVQKWARCIGHPRLDKDSVIGMFGIFQDVTSFRHRLFDYMESQNRLKIALSANHMGVWDWNLKEDILVWDDSMFSIFEIDKDTFPNNYSGIERIQHPDDIPRVREAVEEAIRTGNEFNTWFRIYTPSGIKFIAAKGRLTNTNTDNPWLTGVNWDITKEKVQEDTINIQQAQMVTSARLSSLGEMAGGIAHEINNPLSIILGRAGQLKRKVSSGRADQTEIIHGLTNIESTCERIVKIIKGLRAFSRNADSDPFVLVDINTVIQDVIVLIAEKFKHHSIDISYDLKFDGKIMGRTVQLGQVLMNLLSNAFDALVERDEKWVRISTNEVDGYLHLIITDAGTGISSTIQEKMFQPFFTTKEVGKGTGLGLAISRGIVEDHNGSFFIDSKSQHTSFVVAIPAVR